MFTSDFIEKNIGEVKLTDKKLDDILELLNVIYPHKAKEIDGKTPDLTIVFNNNIFLL
jgi:hypothetical protein